MKAPVEHTSVVVVDSDSSFCHNVVERMAARNATVMAYASLSDGLRAVRRDRPDMVWTEAHLPDGDGFALLEAGVRNQIPVVMLASKPESELVFAAHARGAFDCVFKPLADAQLETLLTDVRSRRPASSRCRLSLAEDGAYDDPDDFVIGTCPRTIEALKMAGQVARTETTVLVRGESGTGKELMARALHRISERTGPFVAVNCAAVVESLAESELFGHERGAFTGASERRTGCFERAHRGTLFLDEVGDAPPTFQAKLLRVLDRGEFYRVGGRDLIRPDVRVVAATNRPLEEAVEEGVFRKDLYYRLGEIGIDLPPLRERPRDIPRLAERLLERANHKFKRKVEGMSEEAVESLCSHDWPGNARELQNVINRAAVCCRGPILQAIDLAMSLRRSVPQTDAPAFTLREMERAHIVRTLDAAGWSRGRACGLLGVSRPTLRRKMRLYGLQDPMKHDDRVDA